MIADALNCFPVIAPAAYMALAAMLVLLVELIAPNQKQLPRFTGLLLTALIFVVTAVNTSSVSCSAFYHSVTSDSFTWFFNLLFSGVAFFVIALSGPYFIRTGMKQPETIALVLFATAGAMLMTIASDFIVLFLGLELMSVCLYVLAGMHRDRPKSNEAALKYFLLGAFSTGFFLYGLALLYGVANSTNYADIATWASRHTTFDYGVVFWAGVALTLIGFFFKTASVPFHFWSPDAYEGAPTPVTAFFSTGPKAAAFGALLKFTAVALPTLQLSLAPLFTAVAIITIAVGNIVALQQTSVKRMLAYSSISHAGYLLVALVAGYEDGAGSLMLYLIVYSVTNLGAFTIASLVNRKNNGDYSYDSYNGLASKHPWLAGMMAVFMISLAGIPPTAGFFGKYYIFYSAVLTGHLYLAITMALFSAISVYYYLKIIVHMYMKPLPDNAEPVAWDGLTGISLSICGLAIFLIGLLPASWLQTVANGVHAIGR